jgi:hypothetical protein
MATVELSPTLTAALGRPVAVSYLAVRRGSRRLFPESRHRSARIHKKLCRRWGGEYALEPAVFNLGSVVLVHPAMFERVLEALTTERQQSSRGQQSCASTGGVLR